MKLYIDPFSYLHDQTKFPTIYSSAIRLGNLLDFGHLLKPLATINLPKSPTILGNFCKGVKISYFSCEIIFGQLLKTFGNFYMVTLMNSHSMLVPNRRLSNLLNKISSVGRGEIFDFGFTTSIKILHYFDDRWRPPSGIERDHSKSRVLPNAIKLIFPKDNLHKIAVGFLCIIWGTKWVCMCKFHHQDYELLVLYRWCKYVHLKTHWVP